MDFSTAAKLGTYLAKPYAERFFELLVNYKDISASEAASLLDLHVKTAQDFLEAMTSLEVLSKEEVREKKRPYYRYALQQMRITVDIDLSKIKKGGLPEARTKRIRERSNSRVRFSQARGKEAVSAVTVWTGNSRERHERKFNLTPAQGKFIYHLPFPGSEPATVDKLMTLADIQPEYTAEVLDMIELLVEYQVVEIC